MAVNQSADPLLFAVDTGGTFTDLLVRMPDGKATMFKAATTPDDPVRGVLDVLSIAADAFDLSLGAFLARGARLVHGTTHALNAIVTGNTARTALLVTEGHPDILTLREGGRTGAFDFQVPYPRPFVPRALTFEIPERIRSDGSVFLPLDEDGAARAIERVAEEKVEAVAVCLLWSIANGDHEKRVGDMIAQRIPDIPYTLSHQLNPAIREFRRASSTVVDAALKPLMAAYMTHLDARLKEAGFGGRTLVVTSQAGVIDAADAAKAPIHIVNSGPSMAPIAGRHFGKLEADTDTVIVADTGGTTYDVSLVREGHIPTTLDTWVGPQYRGVMIGFPWVDVKSVGAGGGSIAWVDTGGLLHVGPQSAGAVPGPASYGNGGTNATVSDASLVLGHLDPKTFLGGKMTLDVEAAKNATGTVADRLGLSLEETADAILDIATENMAQAIIDITVSQGVDPTKAVLIGGGGAAGLNSVRVARRLGCKSVLFPQASAVLSAAGASISDLKADFRSARFVTTANLDHGTVAEAFAELEAKAREFLENSGKGAISTEVSFAVDARYATQVWEIEVPLGDNRLTNDADIAEFEDRFHDVHKTLFAFADKESAVEIIGWSAEARCRFAGTTDLKLTQDSAGESSVERHAYFQATGWIRVPVHRWNDLKSGTTVTGPAIVENDLSTIVIEPDATAERKSQGGLLVQLGESV